MTTSDFFMNQPADDTPAWLGQWVNHEWEVLEFDVADQVLAGLDIEPVSEADGAQWDTVMETYYRSVAEQCPDLWPGILRQLKRSKRVTIAWPSIAAAVLLVGVLASGLAPHSVPSANPMVAELSAINNAKSGLPGKPIPFVKSAAMPETMVKAPQSRPSKHMLVRVKRFGHLMHYQHRGGSAVEAEASRSQRVQAAILAAAAERIRQEPSAPASLEYVFNVSAPAKDALVLGLATP